MFILKGKLIQFTKDIINPVKIILLSAIFLILVIFLKYKPVYSVTLSGKTLGYVTEKSELENEINEYINNIEGTVALIDIEVMPEYTFDLVSRDEETREVEILEKIEKTAIITYRTYGVTVNGEVKTEVDTESEALEIIDNLSQDVEEGVDFELGFTEIYTTEENTSVTESEALEIVSEIKTAKIEEYEAEQARIAAEKAATAAAAKKSSTVQGSSVAVSVASYGSYGVVNGISISNPLKTSVLITSRFGERSSIRSSAHTGLDLAVSLGTPIYPIASGTVTTASYQGSYGNLIIIDHGNGVQSYYGHCSSINVSVGDTVTTDTVIGAVGSTGNSTGPHLHLEIRINGVAYNPQNYLY